MLDQRRKDENKIKGNRKSDPRQKKVEEENQAVRDRE